MIDSRPFTPLFNNGCHYNDEIWHFNYNKKWSIVQMFDWGGRYRASVETLYTRSNLLTYVDWLVDNPRRLVDIDRLGLTRIDWLAGVA